MARAKEKYGTSPNKKTYTPFFTDAYPTLSAKTLNLKISKTEHF